MKSYRDDAIVVRTHPLGEADRIVTLLTTGHGLVRVAAKGVRRTSSRWGARLEPFSVIQVMIHRGRSLDILTQAQTIRPYGMRLAGDYELYTRAQVIAEATEKFCEDGEADATYALLLGALHALAYRRHQPDLVMNSYLLRLVALGGWAPSLFACAQCGRPGAAAGFDVPSGGVVCEQCRPAGALAPHADTLALLADLISGDWSRADASPTWTVREASQVVSAWVQWHAERRISSYRFVSAPDLPLTAPGARR